MTDSEKQSSFVAGLRQAAEAAAAKNPILADKRTIAKALVTEARMRIAGKQDYSPLGAYMQNDGQVSIIPSEHESSLPSYQTLMSVQTTRCTAPEFVLQ